MPNLHTCSKLAFLLAGSILLPTYSHAALIDFNDGVANEILTNQYALQGVTFSNAQRSPTLGLAGSDSPYGLTAIGSYQWFSDTPVIAYFSGDVSDVSITGIDVGENGLRMNAYDDLTGGNLVDFSEVFGVDLGHNQHFTLAAHAAHIKRVEIYQVQHLSIDGVLLDDLRFSNPTQVPIPASSMLMGLGLLGWRLSVRQKTATQVFSA